MNGASDRPARSFLWFYCQSCLPGCRVPVTCVFKSHSGLEILETVDRDAETGLRSVPEFFGGAGESELDALL